MTPLSQSSGTSSGLQSQSPPTGSTVSGSASQHSQTPSFRSTAYGGDVSPIRRSRGPVSYRYAPARASREELEEQEQEQPDNAEESDEAEEEATEQ